jgi:uncharacterized protein (TIGR04222 family)
MNPFDLPGPQFLGFYAALFVVCIGAATWLRAHLRQPVDEPFTDEPELAPYEVAYLSGGEAMTINAAIARLVHEHALGYSTRESKLTLGREALPAGASELERAVHEAVDKTGAAVASVRAQAAPALASIREALQEKGLLVADDQAALARLAPTALALLPPFVGLIKIFVGLSRSRPVEFLIVACILSTVVALVGFARGVHRSRRGDRALARLKEANAAMAHSVPRRLEQTAPDDLVLAMGLFGVGVLASSPLADLHGLLRPPPSSNSGACGSSGCGGGGGGCGGGCGGGGCGGCGG